LKPLKVDKHDWVYLVRCNPSNQLAESVFLSSLSYLKNFSIGLDDHIVLHPLVLHYTLPIRMLEAGGILDILDEFR